MNLSQTSVMQLSRQKLNFLGQRQAVLALNVANVDTPNYQARDIKEPDFKAMLNGAGAVGSNSALARTHRGHMLPKGNGAFAVTDRASIFERNPNSNRVNIDEEMQQISFTQSEYNKVISIYKKNIGMYRMALGAGNGG